MVQQRSVQLDYICTRPKTLEINDKICIGHLRAFSPWILMMMMELPNKSIPFLLLNMLVNKRYNFELLKLHRIIEVTQMIMQSIPYHSSSSTSYYKRWYNP